MRINIKKYNSKTYSTKEYYGKGPSKQKKKEPLFKRDTFHTVKEDLIKLKVDSILKEEFSGLVTINSVLLKDYIHWIPEKERALVQMHIELQTVFSINFEKRSPIEDIYWTISSEPSFMKLIELNGSSKEVLHVPLILLKPIEPTDEEVNIELINRELNK